MKNIKKPHAILISLVLVFITLFVSCNKPVNHMNLQLVEKHAALKRQTDLYAQVSAITLSRPVATAAIIAQGVWFSDILGGYIQPDLKLASAGEAFVGAAYCLWNSVNQQQCLLVFEQLSRLASELIHINTELKAMALKLE